MSHLLADLGWVDIDFSIVTLAGKLLRYLPTIPAVRWSISNLTQLNLSLLSDETPFKWTTSVSWILLYFHMRFVGGNLATHIAYFWLDGRRTFTSFHHSIHHHPAHHRRCLTRSLSLFSFHIDAVHSFLTLFCFALIYVVWSSFCLFACRRLRRQTSCTEPRSTSLGGWKKGGNIPHSKITLDK